MRISKYHIFYSIGESIVFYAWGKTNYTLLLKFWGFCFMRVLYERFLVRSLLYKDAKIYILKFYGLEAHDKPIPIRGKFFDTYCNKEVYFFRFSHVIDELGSRVSHNIVRQNSVIYLITCQINHMPPLDCFTYRFKAKFTNIFFV